MNTRVVFSIIAVGVLVFFSYQFYAHEGAELSTTLEDEVVEEVLMKDMELEYKKPEEQGSQEKSSLHANEVKQNNQKEVATKLDEGSEGKEQALPVVLSLPFSIEDIDESNGEVNPLGVVRFSQDQADIGHSGIDFPLGQNADIYSVADGEIVLLEPDVDPWGGWKIFHLLEQAGSGEGKAFIYEHVTPVDGLSVGDKVKRGELIAAKTAPNQFTAHFQFSDIFNDYKYISSVFCWPDSLIENDRRALNDWWSKYGNSSYLLSIWGSQEQFSGLLNKSLYPNGPQLCYPLGTDVR